MRHLNQLLVIATVLASSARAAIARDADPANEILLRATSPYEDMVEAALAKDDKGVTEALAAADDDAAAVREKLSASAAEEFAKRLLSLHASAGAKDYQKAATLAVGEFRLLLDGVHPDALSKPQEVNLLDYAGFQLHVLAAAPKPDWKAIRRVVDDAAAWWKATKPRVKDRALSDAFSSTIRGLHEAAESENLAMLEFAAQMDLDLVDLLENFFEP